MEAPKNDPPVGPRHMDMANLAPALMAELMQQFIDRKSLNDRAMIRLKVKALQDYFSADTGYPNVPVIDHGNRRARHGPAAAPFLQADDGVAPAPFVGHRAGGAAAALQEDVAEAVQAEEAARGFAPAPGAPRAPGMPEVP